MAYLMKCGHVANAYSTDNPVCAICAGLKGYDEVDKELHGSEGLEGRMAKYNGHTGGGGIVPSRWELPFFKYQPSKEHDSYYCGCWGWD